MQHQSRHGAVLLLVGSLALVAWTVVGNSSTAPAAPAEQAARGRQEPQQLQEQVGRLEKQAQAHEQQEDFAAARREREQILELQTKFYGAGDWRVTDARLALARLERVARMGQEQRRRLAEAGQLLQRSRALRQQRKFQEAEGCARKAADAYQELLGEKDQDYARALEELGLVHTLEGEYKQAASLFRQALAIWKPALGDQHPHIAMSLNNLGIILHHLPDLAAARKAHEEALAIRRKVLPPNHPDIAMSLSNLGVVLQELGDLPAARQAHEEALAIRRKALPPDDPHIAMSLYNLGTVLHDLHDLPAARKAYEEALAIRRKALPPDHSHIAMSLNNLGAVLHDLGDLPAARQAHEEALAIYRKALPPDHPDIAGSLNNLGIVLRDLHDLPAARKAHEEALAICRKALPPNHPLIADSLYNLGNVLYDLHDLPAARKAHEEALAIRRKALPPDHPDIAQSLNNLGAVLHDLHDLPAARKALEEALAIYRKVRPPNHPDIARSLNNLGAVLRDLGDLPAARKDHEEALAIRRKALPHDHPDIADSLNNLGLVLHDLREFPAARKAYEEALAIRRKALPHDDPHIADSLNNLGNVLQDLGDLPAARKAHEEALAICRKALPPNDPHIADSLNNLGNVLADLGDLPAARKALEEALAIDRKVLPPDYPRIATSLNNLGDVLWELHDLPAARKLYEEALAIFRKALPPDHPDIAMSLNNLGNVLYDLHDLPAARKVYEEALAIFRKALPPNHPHIATSLNGLGGVLYDLHDLPAARKLYEEALAIYRKALPPDHPAIAMSLNNLGIVLHDLRDLPAARKALEEALAIYRKALPPDDPHIAASLSNLGIILQELGDLPAARKAHEEALAIRRKALPHDHPAIAMSLNNLGAVQHAEGKPAEAELLLREAVHLGSRAAEDAALAQGEREQLALASADRRYLDNLLKVAAACKHLPAAYADVLAVKGSVTARQRWLHLARRIQDPETAALLDEFGRINRQLLALGLQRPDEPRPRWTPDGLRREADRLLAERSRLESRLNERSLAFRQERRLAAVSPEQVRRALPPGTALVDFLEYVNASPAKGPQLVAFVLRPDRAGVIAVELGPSQAVDEWVQKWRKSYGVGDWPPDGDADPGVRLRQLVWTPVEKYLDGIHLVLLSPDGALTGLPFAALPGRSRGSWLLQRYAFATLPVPQLLPEMLAGPPAAGTRPSLLVMGGIDYNASDLDLLVGAAGTVVSAASGAAQHARPRLRDRQFNRLEGSEEEVEHVEQAFSKAFPGARVKPLKGTAATKEAFLREASQYRWLHLSTHGYFAEESAASALDVNSRRQAAGGSSLLLPEAGSWEPELLSGVAFAGANRAHRAGGPGILTALEAAEPDLRGVDLLMLSACQTGLGRRAGGEGVLGLQRAFQVAGARSVAATLWSVPDRDTEPLMQRFYDNLWKRHLGRLEALREAQLWIVRGSPAAMDDLVDPHPAAGNTGLLASPQDQEDRGVSPYWWASFLLSGDWR